MKKRLVIILCIAALLLTPAITFAAGGQGEASTEETPTITVMVNSGAAAHHRPASNDLAAYQAREEFSGIHVEWDVIETANYNEIVGARLASGVSLPDVMRIGGNLFEKAREEELIIPLDDLIESNGPNLKKWFAKEENGIFNASWRSPDGNLYGINNKVLPNNLSLNIMFAVPWLERLGLEQPTTTDEALDVWRKFRDEDANGNGNPNDEVPYVTSVGGLQFLGNSFGLRGSTSGAPYNFEGGKVTWNYTDDRYKALLKFLNTMWEEGLIDKEFANVNSVIQLERTANDIAGSVYFWSTWAYKFSSAHPDGDPKGEKPLFTIAPPLEGPFGDKYFEKRIIPGGGGLTISSASKVPETAMEWIDFVYASEKGFEVYAWGVEDITFKYDGGNKVKIEAPDGVAWNEAMLRIGAGQPPWSHEQSILAWKAIMPAWQFPFDDLNRKYYIEPFPPLAKTQAEIETVNEFSTDINTYFGEMRMKFILGQADIDATWDEYVRTLKRMGSDELLRVHQQIYDRYMAMQ